MARFTFNVPDSLYDELKAIAKKERRSITGQLLIFMEEGIRYYEKKEHCPKPTEQDSPPSDIAKEM
jgi:hypothetical protein